MEQNLGPNSQPQQKQRPGTLGKTKENSGSWHSNRGGTSVPAALGPPPTPHVHGDRDVGEGKEDLGRTLKSRSGSPSLEAQSATKLHAKVRGATAADGLTIF